MVMAMAMAMAMATTIAKRAGKIFRVMIVQQIMKCAAVMGLLVLSGLAAEQALSASPSTFDIGEHWAVRANGSARLSAAARALVTTEGRPSSYARAELFSRHALLANPLQNGALATLGRAMEAQKRDIRNVRSVFETSKRVSRRDALTIAWMIEEHAGSNDVLATLREYDVALVVYPGLSELLFPILSNALEDKDIQKGLAEVLKRRPVWQYAALSYAINHGNADDVADLLASLGSLPNEPAARVLEGQLLDRLVTEGKLGVAVPTYLKLTQSSPAVLSRLSFDEETTLPNRQPFTWAMGEGDSLVVSFSKKANPQRITLSADVAPLANVELARKLLMLPAGRFRLQSDANWVGNAGADLKIVLTCILPGSAIPAISMRLPRGQHRTEFTVGVGCLAQIASLRFDSGEGQSAADVTVNTVSLEKVE
jgi:hypothetical protein